MCQIFNLVESNTLAIFRNKCWILNLRGPIRKAITDCLYCQKVSATRNLSFMADILEERLQHNNKPLTNMGTDYFGTCFIKLSKAARSNAANERKYGVIFTFITRCTVHLEKDLSWRGQVRPLMSSNHTSNFK